MKISTKLATLVAIPLLSLILLGLIAAQTLQQVRIGGDAYGRIVERKDLIADVLPPPLYLVEANLAAHRMVATASTAEPGDLLALNKSLGELKTQYDDRLNYWLERLDGNDPVTKQLFDQVDVAGQEFWRVYEEEYSPSFRGVADKAVEMGGQIPADQRVTVLAPVNDSLERLNTAFETHDEAVRELVAMAQADLDLQEAAADDLTRQQTILLAGAALAIVAIVAAAGSLMARSISGPIRSLTKAANEAATSSLPELVQMVRELPAGAELPALPPLQVDGSEEIKQLSASFESLRNTAVQLAAGESQLRQNVSAMFVNLGRRNQNLLNRTLNFITSLEENERNPETLDNLFRLDHLVTRMRRNAESLLVLAGTESTRTWSQPVEIGDIVRGALSEIEAYDRVDIGGLEPVEVRGNAAADVSHMMAELLENATTFSPPSAPVSIIGKYAHDGYLLSITDNGIGMTQKELRDANDRLSQAGKFDTSPLMVLGLFVVSRLAVRHGIQVRLAESPAEGVTAKVKLPLELLEGTNPENHLVPPDEDFTPTEVVPADPSALLGLGGALAEFGGGGGMPAPTAPNVPSPVSGAAPMTARRGSGAAPESSEAKAPAPAAAPAPAPPEPKRGLTKRSRGAQMPDTGPDAPVVEEVASEDRSPDQVRNALAAFQGGVEYGRTVDEDGVEIDEPAATAPAPAAAPAAEATAPPPAPAPAQAAEAAKPVEAATPATEAKPVPSGTEPIDAKASAAAPAPTKGGLSRRVKGAHMFDTGPTTHDGPVAVTRSADEVRSALSSFQQGQTQAANESSSPDNGNQ